MRRRFMFNSCRWLWRKITEKVILKSSMDQAPTKAIEIDDSIGNPEDDISLTANDVSDLNIIRATFVHRHIDLQARLRAYPVVIRDITIIKIYNMIMAPAKICKFVRKQTIERVSNLIMCLTYLTSYKVHIIPILTANGIKADTVAVKCKNQKINSNSSVLVDYSDTLENVSINSIVPIDTHYAKIAYWIDPILEDGVLTIVQSYDAVQTGDILEVI